MRAQIMDLSEQLLLIRDNVTLSLDAYVQYKVLLAERTMFEAKIYRLMVRFMTSGVMKTIITEHTLGEILGNRKMIEKKIVGLLMGRQKSMG
jgi:regulator of protease activity HflC (stomatin/prohibitin superfamily)